MRNKDIEKSGKTVRGGEEIRPSLLPFMSLHALISKPVLSRLQIMSTAFLLVSLGALIVMQLVRMSEDKIKDTIAVIDQNVVLQLTEDTSAMRALFTGSKPDHYTLETSEDARKCLAQAIYFEARSEPPEGWVAVADVVINRARNPRYPASICGVVFQGEYRRNRCQFSFACDGRSDRAYNRALWEKALRLADYKLSNISPFPTLTEATHYHADYVTPYWSEKLERVSKIGRHIFYVDPR
jgi:spore germination cell wall hydrolase CwlJ-like protein